MSKGENALALFEDYLAHDRTPPEGLLPPEIMDGYFLWYEAFWELSTDRQYFEGGVSPIPHSSILSYPGIHPDELRSFVMVIRTLDKAWLADYHSQVEAAAKGQKRREHPRKILTL